MLKIKNLVFICICLCTCIVFGTHSTLALEIPQMGDKIELTKCELSESYLEWEKLTEDEKQKTIMPPMCKVSNVKKIKTKNNLFSKGLGEAELPSSYDAREQNYASTVKNQNDTNGCWAFSTTTLLEYYVSKILNFNSVFSTRHMVYSTTREFLNNEINVYGYNKVPSNGGNFFMASNYFINSQGPVLESNMIFENNENTLNISEIQNKTIQLDVNDIVLEYDDEDGKTCTTSEINNIKEYIYKYGSVAISTYMTNESNYYNSNTNAFYYNGAENSNHAVLIVGWNDNYSKNNFSSSNKPNSNGAWIVQNSYGSSFGDNGYYYISYEDIHVCDIYMAIKKADKKVEDNSYIYDTLGFNIFYGYKYGDVEYTSAYAMNVFTKEEKKEKLKEVTIGSAGTGSYSIYYMNGNGKNSSVSNMQLIGSGNLEHAGYVTHILDTPILLEEDVTQFSIAVYYDMDSVTTPLAISSKDDKFYEYVSIDGDKSFTSLNGVSWEDLSNEQGGSLIASIKAFTDNDINSEYDDNILSLYEELKSSAKIYIENNTITDEVYFEFKDGVINKVDKFGNETQEPNMTMDSSISGSGEVRINSSNQVSIVIYDENKNIKNDYGSDRLYDEVLRYSRDNVELFKNLHRLELLAEQYVKEKNLSSNSDWLVFFYIRQFKYGTNLSDTTNQYNIVTGVDANFVKYVEENATNLKPYFEIKNDYTINGHKIDLKHMAASISGLFHTTKFPFSLAYQELEYDSVVSWAGDLHTLMKGSILKVGVKEEYGNYLEATYRLMGTGSFNMEDVYADIDAWLLYYNIKDNTDLNLFEIFNEFYTGSSSKSYKNRFLSFIDVMNDISDDFNTNLVNFEGVVNHFTNIGRGWATITQNEIEIVPTDEEEAEIAAGFVKWINEQAQNENLQEEPEEPEVPEEPEAPEEEQKVITSSIYTIDQDNLQIYVQPSTSINTFISNVDGIIDTYVTDGSVSYEGYVYTGLKVDRYTIIVSGDVTGDGFAKMNDVMTISEYIVDGVGLSESYYKISSDVTGDGLIRMNDVMTISTYIVEGGSL